jgi:hypothetical protein
MSPRIVSTTSLSSGRMRWRSTPTTVPPGPTASAATWSHPPGAAPRSTTASPGSKRSAAASSWASLYAERERYPSCFARF